MAKQSPAKIKKLAAQAKRAGAERRAQKKTERESSTTESNAVIDEYEGVDGVWRELGLATPARRALIEDGLFHVSDLRKTSLASLKELPGMTPNALRVLISEMKKLDLTFRK